MKWGCVALLALTLPCLVPAASVNWHRLGHAVSSVLSFEPRHPQRGSVESGPQSSDSHQAASGSPAFCNDLDCPAFTVVKNESTYQLRKYVASNWVSTTSVGIDYDQASRADFMRLFNYISGKNVEKEKIKMTAPVLNRIIPGQGPACENNFTMSFFMAPIVTNPPAPSNKDVFLSTLPTMQFYVRSFPGYVLSVDMWLKEARQLAEDLEGKADYVKDYYYTAGYNSPFQLTGRHNEIWFIAL